MDELRGPNIQIVLHIKEGLGFGFLRTPFVVSGSLNGYILETDSVVPSHAPVFDAELVWETDKRRFRSLRVQNVPVKVEVFTTCTQGRKDKVGYLLLSLLSAQPCPSNKIVDVKYTMHRLLGVKSEGKCCHPQLLMSLSIEDRNSTPTPRNELRMFHSNEVAYPLSSHTTGIPTGRSITFALNEYILESKKSVSSPDLQPKLLCDEGLIQIGKGSQLFVLSFVIGVVENLDLLLPESPNNDSMIDCYIMYSIFTHNIMTDRVASSGERGPVRSAPFNQRTSLRLAAELCALARYFAECPHVVARVCHGDTDLGICSLDLRKLIPTEDIKHFIDNFCNTDNALTIQERCYILRCEETTKRKDDGRRPFVDIEMSLKYMGARGVAQRSTLLSARSATELQSAAAGGSPRRRVGSCTSLHAHTAGYNNASGDAHKQTNEIAELIKNMCNSFALSQERILAARLKPSTSDAEVQCEGGNVGDDDGRGEGGDWEPVKLDGRQAEREPVVLETSKSDTCITSPKRAARKDNHTDLVKMALSEADRDSIMRRFVDELEDWKEKQQELHKLQLKRKEEYHLELLAKEWAKQRVELECRLARGIQQCRALAADLAAATDDFRARGHRNSEREKKLLEAKKALEAHYTAKYQELREASLKMEDDMNHQLKVKDMRIEALELKIMQLEKQVDVLKNTMKDIEKEAETRYSGLTKDQTASLIQELRCLEEKLDSAVQSKAFFKEQWGRAVRELHLLKLDTRKQMLSQLQQDRRELGDAGLDTIKDDSESKRNQDAMDIKKLKDDFYVDILANTPALEIDSFITTSGSGVVEMFDDLRSVVKNPINDKLNKLISQRDRLIQDENPNEELLKQLNQEIRSILLNCGS
ncbi:uncharacterized protein LOC114251104 [Bombyx mandarina]|uniref:Uncharacterized protein LOC114251104 n=1 Tax=Bombyx mandarina TaxID=7092 RepID=A0A6J2KJI7_BOMMA|nr:uncharacterized protein LOC114251104 [Bombyx mandarina]